MSASACGKLTVRPCGPIAYSKWTTARAFGRPDRIEPRNCMAERRLFQEVAERIAAMIEGGSYPPGSRLPGEREIAEQLGVSRVTVREAEIALQARGMVTIKTGSGVYA